MSSSNMHRFLLQSLIFIIVKLYFFKCVTDRSSCNVTSACVCECVRAWCMESLLLLWTRPLRNTELPVNSWRDSFYWNYLFLITMESKFKLFHKPVFAFILSKNKKIKSPTDKYGTTTKQNVIYFKNCNKNVTESFFFLFTSN